MKMFKRVSAFIMAFVMVFGLLPVLSATHAHAESYPDKNVTYSGNTNVVHAKYYETRAIAHTYENWYAIYGELPYDAAGGQFPVGGNTDYDPYYDRPMISAVYDNQKIYITYPEVGNTNEFWLLKINNTAVPVKDPNRNGVGHKATVEGADANRLVTFSFSFEELGLELNDLDKTMEFYFYWEGAKKWFAKVLPIVFTSEETALKSEAAVGMVGGDSLDLNVAPGALPEVIGDINDYYAKLVMSEKFVTVVEAGVTINNLPLVEGLATGGNIPGGGNGVKLPNRQYMNGLLFNYRDGKADWYRGSFGFGLVRTSEAGDLALVLLKENYRIDVKPLATYGTSALTADGSSYVSVRMEITYHTETLQHQAGQQYPVTIQWYVNGRYVGGTTLSDIKSWASIGRNKLFIDAVGDETDVTVNNYSVSYKVLSNNVLNGLSESTVLNGNSASAVSGKLNLPATLNTAVGALPITWELTNIAEDGTVKCSQSNTVTAVAKTAADEKTFTFTVADSAHAWDDGVVDPDATCNTPGKKTYTCEVCGATKTEEVPVNDKHNYVETGRTDATCTEDGVVNYKCSICGDTYDEVLTATGAHTGGKADCLNQAICGVCGQPYGETGGHKWVAQEGKDATCTEKGYTAYEKCSVCSAEQGKEDIGVADHTFLKGIASDEVKTEANCDDAAVHYAKCDNCEFVSDDVTVAVGEKLGHKPGAAATCITAQTCTRCPAIITPATGIHNHTVPAGHKDATCIEAGYDKFKCETCDDIKTDVIPATAIHNHTVPADHKDATCIEAGYDKFKCETCDDIKTVDIDIDADAHDMQSVAPQAPDFGVVGWEAYEKCSRCDYTEGYVKIPALIGVAKIGDKLYVSLEAAIADAADGAYIELLGSVSGPGLKIEKNITIDFRGNTYTFTVPATGSAGTTTLGMQILEGYDVTLTNGTLNVAEEYRTFYAVLIQNYADLTISGMTLDGTWLDRYTIKEYDYSYVVSVNCGTVLIENTIIKANDGGEDIALTLDKYSNDTRDYPAPTVTLNDVTVVDGLVRINGATVVINSGNYTGNGSNGLVAIDSGKLTINGGTFDAALGADGYSMAIWAKGGETVINDGLFKNKADFEGDPDHGSDLIYAKFDAYVEITGGTFEAADERWALNLHRFSPDAIIVVKGGSFKGFNPHDNNTENPKFNYLAAGCKAELVGEYYVVSDGTPDGYHWCEDGTLNELVYHEGQTATCTQIGWDAYEECTCGCYSTYVELPKLAHVYELDGEIWKCVCGKLPTGVINGNGVAINVVKGVPTAGTCYTNGIEGVIAAGGYMFDEDGLLFTGVAGEGAARRYYNNGIYARYTLVTDGVNVYYATADGSFAKGYTYVSGTFDAVNYPANRFYMFDAETGALIASSFVDGKYYDENGALVRWKMVKFEGNYYYLNGKGEVATGYTNVDHSITEDMPVGYYMLDENGQRLTGFDDNGVFYRDGRKITWKMVKFEGNYYYLNGKGEVATGYTNVDHSITEDMPVGYYMLDENGQRLTGFADNGVFYRNGRQITWKMVEFEGNYYYLLGNGTAAKGRRWVDHTVNAELIPTGKNYNFDLVTGALILN